jgi:hypothetical protein
VYFLFGEGENAAKPFVYVGQTEEIRKRLDNHNSKKDFWRTVVLITSRTQSFTQAHIRYLEWHCLCKAKEVKRYDVKNDQTPAKPKLTEPMEADCLEVFDTLSVLISTLGYPVFEPITKAGYVDRFFCKGPDADAAGELVEDGFVVFKGSRARKELAPSAVTLVTNLRQPLIDDGILTEDKQQYLFTEDYLFPTPSTAAKVVLGRSANGWDEWKNKNEKTLSEVKREPPLEADDIDDFTP